MRRKAPADSPVHRIDPLNVCSVHTARVALGVESGTVIKEIREGRLRASFRCGRYFLLGEHLLDWIRGGEGRSPLAGRKPRKSDADGTGTGDAAAEDEAPADRGSAAREREACARLAEAMGAPEVAEAIRGRAAAEKTAK